ncbi:hypothetical protein KAR91_16690, partial [Candidatus Pacearchaeota archaeon]|nr:hypothetical protein [Candidatus Pacearchaeota archaeon]
PVLYDAMHFLYMRAWLVRKNTPAETVRNLVKLVDNNGLNSMLARSHINKNNIFLYIGLYFYMHCLWKASTSNSISDNIKECIDILLVEHPNEQSEVIIK